MPTTPRLSLQRSDILPLPPPPPLIDLPQDGEQQTHGEHADGDAESSSVAGLVVGAEDLRPVDPGDVGAHNYPNHEDQYKGNTAGRWKEWKDEWE